MVILTELSALFGANVLKVVSRGITGPGRYGRKRGRRKISASSPMGRFYGTGMRLTSDAAGSQQPQLRGQHFAVLGLRSGEPEQGPCPSVVRRWVAAMLAGWM